MANSAEPFDGKGNTSPEDNSPTTKHTGPEYMQYPSDLPKGKRQTPSEFGEFGGSGERPLYGIPEAKRLKIDHDSIPPSGLPPRIHHDNVKQQHPRPSFPSPEPPTRRVRYEPRPHYPQAGGDLFLPYMMALGPIDESLAKELAEGLASIYPPPSQVPTSEPEEQQDEESPYVEIVEDEEATPRILKDPAQAVMNAYRARLAEIDSMNRNPPPLPISPEITLLPPKEDVIQAVAPYMGPVRRIIIKPQAQPMSPGDDIGSETNDIQNDIKSQLFDYSRDENRMELDSYEDDASGYEASSGRTSQSAIMEMDAKNGFPPSYFLEQHITEEDSDSVYSEPTFDFDIEGLDEIDPHFTYISPHTRECDPDFIYDLPTNSPTQKEDNQPSHDTRAPKNFQWLCDQYNVPPEQVIQEARSPDTEPVNRKGFNEKIGGLWIRDRINDLVMNPESDLACYIAELIREAFVAKAQLEKKAVPIPKNFRQRILPEYPLNRGGGSVMERFSGIRAFLNSELCQKLEGRTPQDIVIHPNVPKEVLVQMHQALMSTFKLKLRQFVPGDLSKAGIYMRYGQEGEVLLEENQGLTPEALVQWSRSFTLANFANAVACTDCGCDVNAGGHGAKLLPVYVARRKMFKKDNFAILVILNIWVGEGYLKTHYYTRIEKGPKVSASWACSKIRTHLCSDQIAKQIAVGITQPHESPDSSVGGSDSEESGDLNYNYKRCMEQAKRESLAGTMPEGGKEVLEVLGFKPFQRGPWWVADTMTGRTEGSLQMRVEGRGAETSGSLLQSVQLRIWSKISIGLDHNGQRKRAQREGVKWDEEVGVEREFEDYIKTVMLFLGSVTFGVRGFWLCGSQNSCGATACEDLVRE